jgi:hypothetical protein
MLNPFMIIYEGMFSNGRFPVASDKEVLIFRVAWFLDKASNPKLWRLLPASQMMIVAQRLIYFNSHLMLMLRFGLSEEFIGLCLYHTTSLCRYLPKDSKLALLTSFLQQRNFLWQVLREILNEQPTELVTVYVQKNSDRSKTSRLRVSIGGGQSLAQLIKAGLEAPMLFSEIALPG